MIRIDIRLHQQTRNAYGALAEVMKSEREQQVQVIDNFDKMWDGTSKIIFIES